jgi:hypothetical protein
MKIFTGVLIGTALVLSVVAVSVLVVQYSEKDFVERIRKAGL